jgi:hypothetical protein
MQSTLKIKHFLGSFGNFQSASPTSLIRPVRALSICTRVPTLLSSGSSIRCSPSNELISWRSPGGNSCNQWLGSVHPRRCAEGSRTAASRATAPATTKRVVALSRSAAAHAPPHNDAAPGLDVSRRHVFQYCFTSDGSPTSLFSRVFSFSSSFIRSAGPNFNPPSPSRVYRHRRRSRRSASADNKGLVGFVSQKNKTMVDLTRFLSGPSNRTVRVKVF